MQFTVQEQFIQGKTTEESACEDFIVIAPNVVAIIDGATDKSGQTYKGMSSGRFAGQTIADKLPELAEKSFSSHALIEDITACLRQAIANELKGRDIKIAAMPSLTILAYLPEHSVMIRVGDSPFLLDSALNSGTMKIDHVTSMARACYIELGLMNGDFTEEELYTEDHGRSFIMPLLQKQHLLANNPQSSFGYGVINGSPVPEKFIEIISTKGVQNIVMSSDGYPDLKPTLKESEEALKLILQQDPLFFRQRYSTKGLKDGFVSYDDRAYISLQLSHGQ